MHFHAALGWFCKKVAKKLPAKTLSSLNYFTFGPHNQSYQTEKLEELKIQKNSDPLILFVSDLHVGSTVGIMPNEYETYEGQVVRPNSLQLYMLSHWEKCIQDFEVYRKKRKFWLVLVGDLTEGIHHKTKQVWSPDAKDHALASIQLLSPLCEKADRVFVCKGTESHVGNDEESIAKELGATKCPDTGRHAWDTVSIEVGNHLIQCRHHMPTSSRVYLEASALSIILGNTQLSYARHKQRIPDIVVSGHRHRFGYYQDDESAMLALGAWQALTRYGHKVVPGAIFKLGFGVMDWVRGPDQLPYCFVIKQPLKKRIETPVKW
jgi:UDP-2,3-diacylglucosamine pyrophosphatase LpxH